ncbi:hypothetical protein [Stieleria mannarensis]|uniref:hypothetical protein n=1 Tax=Stieleria mannarensis TaxID=2755585 RepID=UPI00160494E3|nr:hypothetical protein [Rhodopirellula sp. JC639]
MHRLPVMTARITTAPTTILASVWAITAFGIVGCGLVGCGLVGCGRPPAPEPTVITDTGSDLRHDHKHFHGDPHRHDHDHEGTFQGAHSHPHAHAHRHPPAPHGGLIVSLRLTGQQREPSGQSSSGQSSSVPLAPRMPPRPHLEIVTGLPERLTFYFLAESEDGRWDRWDVGPSPTVAFTAAATARSLELTRAADQDGYIAPLGPELQALLTGAASEIRLTDWVIHAAGRSFDISGKLVFGQGELDVVLD